MCCCTQAWRDTVRATGRSPLRFEHINFQLRPVAEESNCRDHEKYFNSLIMPILAPCLWAETSLALFKSSLCSL